MMKYLFPFFLFFFVINACQSGSNEQMQNRQNNVRAKVLPPPPPAPKPKLKPKDKYVAKTSTGKAFVVKRKKSEGEKTKYVLSGEGFKFAEPTNLPNHAPVKDVFTADLDGNGFDEAYVIYDCQEKGDAHPIIAAYVSFKDRSFGPIYVKSASAKKLDGYKGDDKIFIENGQLFREFPIYDGDTKTGQTSKMKYKLVAGEAGYTLLID